MKEWSDRRWVMNKILNLKVWQRSHTLVLSIYKETKRFPTEEKFRLTQQLRRSAVSISANIAEGSKRKTDKEYCHFLFISQGSLEEVKYYLLLSRDLHYISHQRFLDLFSIAEDVGKLLYGFINKLMA